MEVAALIFSNVALSQLLIDKCLEVIGHDYHIGHHGGDLEQIFSQMSLVRIAEQHLN